MGGSQIDVRAYAPADEGGWLKCRVLSFMHTAYFDDVVTAKPVYDHAVELVAVDGESVVGVLDTSIEGDSATIETIAVDPTSFRRGVGSALLNETRARLAATVRSLDAWTRDDLQANGWYAANGFIETFRYLHVYASHGEANLIGTPPLGLTLVKGFFHGRIEDEVLLRAQFERVHVCRRYELQL